MDEVGTAVIAISLVLIAVFVPTAFIPGISGQFYLQFAITIAVSTAISAFNSLTLSPALAGAAVQAAPWPAAPPRFFLARFGRGARRRLQPRLRPAARTAMRASSASWSARAIALVGMLRRLCRAASAPPSTWCRSVPRGFIPTLDQGYAIVVIQLPDGASLSRTDAVVKQASEIIQEDAGRRRCRRLRRLLRRDLHQRQQCRRDLRALRAVRASG